MVIPVKKAEQLTFFEQRVPIWVTNAEALGIPADQAADLTTLVAAARITYDAAQDLRDQAEAATINQNTTLSAMRSLGAGLIKTIRNTAQIEDNPSLYALAQIPAPKDPAPIPPVEAANVEFDLLTSGALELTWDGSVSTGTVYLVERAVTMPGLPTGAFEPLGVADEKTFVDATIPSGAQRAAYVVKARKGGQTTPGTAPITVRLTQGGNGQTIAMAA